MIIKGEAQWASIKVPNTTFEPCWTIDLLIDKMTADSVLKESKKFNSKGLRMKKEEDGRFRIKIKRDVNRADGDGENKQPVLRDQRNRDFDELVGNGSTVLVHCSFFEWTWKNTNGVGADLKGVQVLKHVPYGEPDGDAFTDTADKEENLSSDQADEEDFDEI